MIRELELEQRQGFYQLSSIVFSYFSFHRNSSAREAKPNIHLTYLYLSTRLAHLHSAFFENETLFFFGIKKTKDSLKELNNINPK